MFINKRGCSLPHPPVPPDTDTQVTHLRTHATSYLRMLSISAPPPPATAAAAARLASQAAKGARISYRSPSFGPSGDSSTAALRGGLGEQAPTVLEDIGTAPWREKAAETASSTALWASICKKQVPGCDGSAV